MSIDRDKILQAAQKFVDKKKYDKAVIEYQKLVQSDPTDARTLLKIGDLQSKMGAYPEAIATYEGVGKVYSQQGFALKAIAVYKQIRELIIKHAPQLEERYGHITPKLAELYKQLGLVSDALAALARQIPDDARSLRTRSGFMGANHPRIVGLGGSRDGRWIRVGAPMAPAPARACSDRATLLGRRPIEARL